VSNLNYFSSNGEKYSVIKTAEGVSILQGNTSKLECEQYSFKQSKKKNEIQNKESKAKKKKRN